MSVLIKGMEMPPSCEKCRFSGFGGLRNERVVCMFTGANAYMNEVQYLDDCPLVPVPPHGRLIDADELLNDLIAEDYKEHPFCYPCGEILRSVKNAPAILEAEH